MPEPKKEPEPLTVVDRRRFTSEGERRRDAEPAPPAAPEPPQGKAAPAPPRPETSAPRAESDPARQARQAYERQSGRAGERKSDMETLILSLSTSAMIQLGLVEDPAGGRIPTDFEAARHTIDMLAVVQEKTRGNLTPQEEQLLEQVLYELRLAYVNLSSGARPGASRSKASP
jgi:hypothetical protein